MEESKSKKRTKPEGTINESQIKSKKLKLEDVNWTDGKRIFVNRLGLYSADSIKPHFLTFSDVLHPTLGKTPITSKSQVVKKVIFTTYTYDQELIKSVIDAKLPIVIIRDRPEGLHVKVKKDKENSNVTHIFPAKALGLTYGVFHAKLILLEFAKFLRVVITSANLTVEDWTLLSQVIWLQDFPLNKQTNTHPFYCQLRDFLKCCLPEEYKLPIAIKDYDYKEAKVDLVSSVVGRFTGEKIAKYGLGRIKEIMNGTEFKVKPTLTYQTSSIGSLKKKYLKDLYKAWSGNVKGDFKIEIQYPTKDYMKNTILGTDAGNCIILSKKTFKDEEFPVSSLREVEPLEDYKGHIFHAKVGILTSKHEINDNTAIYIGSHNISSSAWGKSEKNNTQLCIANYELGIIFKPEHNSREMKEAIIRALMFKFPPRKYKKGDVPWIYEEHAK